MSIVLSEQKKEKYVPESAAARLLTLGKFHHSSVFQSLSITLGVFFFSSSEVSAVAFLMMLDYSISPQIRPFVLDMK